MPKIKVVIINIPLNADNHKILVFNLCKMASYVIFAIVNKSKIW